MRLNKKYGIGLLFVIINYVAVNAQTVINVNTVGIGGPDVNYKRGVAAPGQNGFFDSPNMRSFLDYHKSIGMGIFNGIRNIYKDPLTNEFYQENGVFKNQQIAPFTDIRKYADNIGFEMISQVGGTPTNSGYNLALDYACTCPDYAPIPSVGTSMIEFQRNFSEWAINADKAVGPNFHSIWIGTQEIAHTIGYRNNIINDSSKRVNILRFLDYWKPIAENLRAAGAKVGGIQLNSSNSNLYQFSVDQMKQKNIELDFLTYQFYQWGNILDLEKAVEALASYNQKYPQAKIIIDRGAWGKLVPEGTQNQIEGLMLFIRGEKACMDNADKIYAYTLDQAVNSIEVDKTNMVYTTKTWINQMPKKRRPLTNLPIGTDGFVTSDETKLTALLWNASANSQNISLLLDNASFGSNSELTVLKAKGSTITSVSATWNATTKRISGFSLDKNEYVMITIQKISNVAPTISLTAPANNALFTAPASVTLRATAEDTDGTIDNVKFYNGTTLLATDNAFPYTFSWVSVGVGTYSITAVATDNNGAVTTSAVNVITVEAANVAPIVSLTAPASNALFTAPASITLTATATDTDGTIDNVKFYNGSTLLATDIASPYTFLWAGVAIGSYSITAVATDNKGAVTTSAVVSITVNSLSSIITDINDLKAAIAVCPKVKLTWTDVVQETGYRIRRRLSSESVFTNIADVTANTTTYTDNTAQAGKNYVYMVRPLQNGVAVNISNTPAITTPLCGAREGQKNITVLIEPNPFDQEFIFEVNSELKNLQAELYDISGMQRNVSVSAISHLRYKVNTKELSSGWYMLKVLTSQGVQKIKVLKL